MLNITKKFFIFLTFNFSLIFLTPAVFAQGMDIDFYGVYSSTGDKNMVDMTRNLYFAQLKEYENAVVTDKSSDAFFKTDNPGELTLIQKETVSPDKVNFFIEIETSGDGRWKSVLHAYSANSQKIMITREYSSYYKILTDTKDAVSQTLKSYKESINANPNSSQNSSMVANKTDKPIQEAIPKSELLTYASTDSIAGTWQGEEYIDKIVILRGGRGFIIYKNGATMSITVSIIQNESSYIVSVVQSGKSNASYYPELSRKIALENAPTAEPLRWELTLMDSDTLSGNKKTLVEDENSPSGAAPGIANVTWKRK